MCPYGPYWRAVRKICIMELLSAKRVQSFSFVREEETTHFVGSIMEVSHTPVNLTHRIFSVVSCVVERLALGRKYVGDEFREIIRSILSGTRARMKKVHKKLDSFFDKVIEEHEMNGKGHEDEQGDLVNVLLRLQKEGDGAVQLTRDNIKAIILDMFIAGIETSSSTLGWAMAELMNNPQVMEKVQKEVRHALKGKERVGEGQVLEYLKHRDYLKNPEKFEPERFSDGLVDYKGQYFDFIPFGGGRRGCPGALFSMATAELVFAQLLYYFDWKLPKGMKPEEMDMSESCGITASRKRDLVLIPIPLFISSRIS
ncbi:hypothetical protein AMTR_s00047p00188760 [Amborella trichopoda]|uniref:Cytochrome P450 n=1 Tax=Amborella trichopoda TaxID=13333 RepID=U5D8T3_AMBTC|nr:hypothetical protein AMTR_s00047p00188760 [Amborella trichopoda]